MMFATMLKSEVKNVLRERMTMVMLVYPLFLGGIGYFLIQREIVSGDGIGLTAMLLTVLAGFLFGAMAGFSLLDDRDDQVLESIQISPVPVQWYIWFKIIFAYILGIFAGFFMIWVTGAVDLGVGDILLLAALSALQVPITAFLINAFAMNKVEGFVTMKGSGFLVIFPVAAFFFLDAKEWLFAFAPAHWVAKAVQHSLLQPMISAGLVEMNLGFYGYIGIGFLYNLLLVAGAFLLFKKKNLL
jgi:fluoroquinolone transport system permease protein